MLENPKKKLSIRVCIGVSTGIRMKNLSSSNNSRLYDLLANRRFILITLKFYSINFFQKSNDIESIDIELEKYILKTVLKRYSSQSNKLPPPEIIKHVFKTPASSTLHTHLIIKSTAIHTGVLVSCLYNDSDILKIRFAFHNVHITTNKFIEKCYGSDE